MHRKNYVLEKMAVPHFVPTLQLADVSYPSAETGENRMNTRFWAQYLISR